MRLLVVGGGITGLAAAWEAVGAGASVVLVETSDALGGKLRTERVGGLLIEHGPDSFVAYRPAAIALAREVGLGDDVIATAGVRSVSLRSRGKLRPLPAGMGMVLPTRLWPFVTTGILSPLDKARAGLDAVMPRRLRSGVDVSIGSLLRARLGGGIVRRFADPMVGGIYGASVDELSLDAVLPSLRADETKYRSLILASLAAGRAARASGRGPGSPFRTLRGGMASLVDAVAACLRDAGADLRLSTTVASVEPAAGGGVRARLAGGETIEADAVVFTGGPASSAELLRAAARGASEALAAVPLATSTIVTLAYPAAAFPAPVTSHGWLEADAAPISGVTISSAKWEGRAPSDTVLIRAFVPERLGPVALLPTAELVPQVVAHVASVLGASGEPALTRVTRWPAVMPKYTVGHLARVAAVEDALAGLPRWRVAGAALRGVGVPDCIADGRRQARAALGLPEASAGGTP